LNAPPRENSFSTVCKLLEELTEECRRDIATEGFDEFLASTSAAAALSDELDRGTDSMVVDHRPDGGPHFRALRTNAEANFATHGVESADRRQVRSGHRQG